MRFYNLLRSIQGRSPRFKAFTSTEKLNSKSPKSLIEKLPAERGSIENEESKTLVMLPV